MIDWFKTFIKNKLKSFFLGYWNSIIFIFGDGVLSRGWIVWLYCKKSKVRDSLTELIDNTYTKRSDIEIIGKLKKLKKLIRKK